MRYYKSPGLPTASPVFDIRDTVLTHPMLPPHMRQVTQVLVNSIGGRAWINVNPGDIVTAQEARQLGLVLLPETPAPDLPPMYPAKPPTTMPKMQGNPHRDPVFEALLRKRR